VSSSRIVNEIRRRFGSTSNTLTRTTSPGVAKVCGVVASAVYEASSRAHPTFVTVVDPDQPNASRTLTAVIYGTDRAKFGVAPEAVLQGQRLCVTGFVSFFRQRPEMILSDPRQLSFVGPQSVAELR
jgi:hypothetical protein